MPCFNASAHLELSIGSVLAQTHEDWELVAVDDGSRDDTWAQLQRFGQTDPRIRCFSQTNAGAAAARNHGLRQARGRLTAFLDADDTWDPAFLEVMDGALAGQPDESIAYCGWQNLGLPGGRGAPFVPPEYEDANKLESLLGGCRWPIHAAMVATRIIREAGSFDENLSSCMDYDLWLRIGSTCRLIRVPQVLAYYHHHGGEQITSNRARIAINHLRAQQKYLVAHPEAVRELGDRRVRELTDGELMRRGFECYWKRDFPSSRTIFRAVMKRRYGGLRDWKYMLPALLPESVHRLLVRLMG
jgi:glycosyltransferase involved in cell wall biosynthesis